MSSRAKRQQHVDNDTWAFAAFTPPPPSGKLAHASAVAPGIHQHFFDNAAAANALKIEKDEILFAEIFLDPAHLPQEVMLRMERWNGEAVGAVGASCILGI